MLQFCYKDYNNLTNTHSIKVILQNRLTRLRYFVILVLGVLKRVKELNKEFHNRL
ncbi:hypothetical protein [Enterococcus phage vB_Efs6_KEN03]